MTLPRTWLLVLAALLWSVPAAMLIGRAYVWTEHLAPWTRAVLLLGTSVLVGLLYRIGFRRIVVQNIVRIQSLPLKARLWHVLSIRGYFMVGGMILMGVVLRKSGLPTLWLVGPYALMGGCLLAGAVHLAVTFSRDIKTAAG